MIRDQKFEQRLARMTLKQKMNAIFSAPHAITIRTTVQRRNGEWYKRVLWEHVQLPSRDRVAGSTRGFASFEALANDCLRYLHNLKDED